MGKIILAIDDEKSVLAFYKIILAEFGEVRTAQNLDEARKQLSGVDLIVLDFYLEHDREQIQNVVPELKLTAPVILSSGIQDISVPALAAELGIAGYWNKSADHEKFRLLVKSVLSKGRS